VHEACRRFPGRIAVGIDAKGGKVAVEGWATVSELEVAELAQRFEGAGVAAPIYPDIDRDGVLAGLNLRATAAPPHAIPTPLIAAGGLAGVRHVGGVLPPEARFRAGAGAGRARFDVRRAALAGLALIAQRHPPRPAETGR